MPADPEQPPEYYLVIDFEATCCDEGMVPRDQMEIIEIGAVMVDASDLQTVDEFQSFIRPVRHSQLTSFRTNLTSIRQQDVDTAPGFLEVMASFEAWLDRYDRFVSCSWGDYDAKQLGQDCEFHRLPDPIRAPHLNLKRLMAERRRLSKKPGLGQTLRLVGLDFAGTPHRGIDDARNIARLLPFIVGDS